MKVHSGAHLCLSIATLPVNRLSRPLSSLLNMAEEPSGDWNRSPPLVPSSRDVSPLLLKSQLSFPLSYDF